MTKKTLLKILRKTLKTYLTDQEIQIVEKAYHYADHAHEGQFRKSKDAYITHPLEVAIILAELEMDSHTISAALLHDTLEDTPLTHANIDREFGREVGKLVEGVTKLGKIDFKSTEEEAAENYRKMFIAMAKDIRVILLKLADRLHNMRTITYKSKKKQQKIALETREIFSPIAHRMGMWRLKWELEDLSFSILDPKAYKKMKSLVVLKREDREAYVEKVCKNIKKLVDEVKIPCVIRGRPKHLYSIYQKLKHQQLEFEELYDTLGIRIILESSKECYEVLGIIHAEFKPISGRFKDYIATPKPNLYQSIHTTVIGPKGKPIEIQIRTKVMHEIAEFGIAAHWHYKEGKEPSTFDGDLYWLRQIIERQKESLAPKDFLRDLKVELFVEEVFVFTPKGDMIVMVAGATPLDFAYRIHTEVGHNCVGAKVNGRIVALNYTLHNGDRIEVLTQAHMEPKIDWLQIVKTSSARHKIRERLKKKNKLERIKIGQEKCERVCLEAGFLPTEVFKKARLKKVLNKFQVNSVEALYLEVFHGEINPDDVVLFIYETYKLCSKNKEWAGLIRTGITRKATKEEELKTSLAPCCYPLPGDAISGLIVLGKGLMIHRSPCPDYVESVKKNPTHMIEVNWQDQSKDISYPCMITIEAFNRPGLILDIMDTLSIKNIVIESFNTHLVDDPNMIAFSALIYCLSLDDFIQLRETLCDISDILTVERRYVHGKKLPA